MPIADSSAIGDTVIAVAAFVPGEKFTGVHISPMSTHLNSDFDKIFRERLLKTSDGKS